MAVTRKTVTVLFADVADSTALGERLDPETLRAALVRWFDEARSVIERHGGTVEKYIGDSVMAVFGIPQLHEDDAIRALRAADELLSRAAGLNEELERDRGLRLTIRVGINTGEVVTGDGGGTLVTGDAVNVAKRLEEAADGGSVIVGTSTRDLVRGAAEFEPLGPLTVKGKSEAVRAWRLLRVDPNALPFERRLDTPLVGRERELDQLWRAFRRSVTERTCHLFTLLGEAGIGKTRLACELFEDVAGEATVVTGRCLPYGDGITFWPLHDVLRDLGGEEEVMRLLSGNADAELICARLTGEPGSQELFWAVRRLCETLARTRPLVLCFEDVHWAEPTFLDLIEYLAGWIRDAPMLLICIARPEFLDERPTWLSGQDNAASLTLRPLSAAESAQLAESLGAAAESRERIIDAAEGNPLFVEQMAAMLLDDGELDAIPATIQALLAARLDRLNPVERSVIECAAVAGKEFWRDAIGALCGAEASSQLSSILMSLVRKELIRPDRSNTRPDDAFRFAHVLIRDAAYSGIPKETRAVLHERFADWLAADSVAPELEEIVGYHLEQAYRNRVTLGPVDEHARAVAERAGEALGRAGRRAYERDDMPAAIKLLDRAVALLTAEHPARLELMRQLTGATFSIGEAARAELLLNGLVEAASAVSDKRYEMYAAFMRTILRSTQGAVPSETLETARAAIRVFDEYGDDVGLAGAWRMSAIALLDRCEFGEAVAAAERALAHARAAGSTREESRCADTLCMSLIDGPTPVEEAAARVETMLSDHAGNRLLEANLMTALAQLRAMQGAFDDARALCSSAGRLYEELRTQLALAGWTQVAAEIESLAGRPHEAERCLRRGYGLLEEVPGFRGYHSVLLADVLCDLGNYADAEQLLEQAAVGGTLAEFIHRAHVRSQLLLQSGATRDAEHVSREAVVRAVATDALNLQGLGLATLADVLDHVGSTTEAAETRNRAIAAYGQKGNVAAAGRAEESLTRTATR